MVAHSVFPELAYNEPNFPMIASLDKTERPENGAPAFTFAQRLKLMAITWSAYLLIRLLGPTLRYQISFAKDGPQDLNFSPTVFVFWHRCILPACYAFRNRKIAVMTSSSFDGEYIARIIELFGYRAVRGSSTRGGVRALLGMHTEIEEGRSAAFTIDGPLGPIYVAKPGPVLLARNTGVPIVAFYVAPQRAWTLNSWDRMLIPKPFSRVSVRIGRYIHVPENARRQELEQLHATMQAALEEVRAEAEAAFRQS
jgi:lysophospholipid acyltransferase (LPLAT)-like uncharacterized protein